MKEEMKKRFQSFHDDLLICQSTLSKKYSALSTIRAITFLGSATLLLLGVSDKILAAGLCGVLLFFVFVWAVFKHGKVAQDQEVCESRLEVVDRYIKRYSNEWMKFGDDGKEYIGEYDTVCADIDLLGANSLYQMISVCHTKLGKEKLAESMKLKHVSISDMKEKNEAIAEMIEKVDFAIVFEAAGVGLENKKKKFDSEEFRQCCDAGKKNIPIWANVLSIVMPSLFVLALVGYFAGIFGIGAPIGILILNIIIAWCSQSMLTIYTASCIVAGYGAENYMCMIEAICAEDFTSKRLSDIKSQIEKEDGVTSAFIKLSTLSELNKIMINPLFFMLLNGCFGWNFHLARMVSSWNKKYSDKMGDCFELIAEIEYILSLSVIGKIRDVNFACIEETTDTYIECVDLRHPLINIENVVSNSARLDKGATIITGSNMSGKTTFLRTIAMNLALAYMGAPVCAKRLSASCMRIFTSMRITDDVANGISTFYAEILRIKAMADNKKKGEPMLCLIDEIFKGTNSADRIVGAKKVISDLSTGNDMVVVSTHDFELCDLKVDDINPVVNYHFEEYYEDDTLKFDYKIKDGRCTTTNAKEILKMAGFSI